MSCLFVPALATSPVAIACEGNCIVSIIDVFIDNYRTGRKVCPLFLINSHRSSFIISGNTHFFLVGCSPILCSVLLVMFSSVDNKAALITLD